MIRYDDNGAPSRSKPAVLVAACLMVAAVAPAQLLDAPASEEAAAGTTRYGEAVPQLFRVGAIVKAKRGACRNILAMVAVPLQCDEQTVRLIEEDFTPNVQQVIYRDLAGGEARQMVVSIPFLEADTEARAVVTFEVATRPILPPDDAETPGLVIPRRVPKHLRRFISPSPFIEAKHPKVKKLSRSLMAQIESAPESGEPNDWTRIETLYDHVLDRIEYIEGPDTSALTTLRDESADCHGRSALFIALCRSIGAPARMVWVQNHCYAEFYLEDADGEGRWLPAESAGSRAFGEMPIGGRTILQKGDNFRVPERPRDRLRYATDYLTGKPVAGSGKPSVEYLREVVR